MADRQHIFRSPIDPAAAPTETGHHWINTSTGREFFSTGVSSVADWKLLPELENTITDGETTKAPTSNAVFDALATKSNTGHTHVAADVTDFNSAADTRVNSGIAAHLALPDPHSQYALESDVAAALAGKETAGAAAAAVAAHVGSADPHSQYAMDADIPAAIATHVADANPHPVYALDTDLSSGLALKADKTTTVSTTEGIQGGGDLSANRTHKLDISGMTALDLPTNGIATNDQLAIYDTSATTHKKISLKDFLSQRARLQDTASVISDDFIVTNNGGLTETGAGTGNSTQAGSYGLDTTENAIGISETDTGTTLTGRRTVASQLNGILATTAKFRFGARHALNQLSTVTDTFTVYLGFLNGTASGDPTDGCFFRYTNGVNGGRWQAVTRRDATETATDTGISADTLYSIFEIEISENGSNVYFYINGTLVATNTTNIITAVIGDAVGYGWKIEKSVGLTSVAHSTDWYYFEIYRTNAR